MNKCQFCKFYRDGICVMPIWADGKFYAGQDTDPERVCALFEEALVTVEEK